MNPRVADLRAPSRLQAWCGLAFVASVWILSHGYEGIRHDGIFYAGAALRAVEPEAFASDFFFMRGSHADLSLFGTIYGRAVAWFGLANAAFLMFALAQLAWFTGLVVLVRRIMPVQGSIVVLTLLAAMNLCYSEWGLLNAAEGFVTSRPFGEAAGLWAIALALFDRYRWAAAVLALGLSLHPAMTAPALGVVALVWAGRRGLLAPVVRIGLFALLVLVAVSQLFEPAWIRRMDPAWYQLVGQTAPLVTPTRWTAAFWLRALVPVLLLWAAARHVGGTHGRLFAIVASVAVAGVALSMLGVVERWALLIAAQPWRALWLAYLMAAIAMAVIAIAEWRRDRTVSLLAMAGICSIVLSEHDWADFVAPAVLLHAGFMLWLVGVPLERRMPRATAIAWAMLAMLLTSALALGVLRSIAIVESVAAGGDGASFAPVVWLDQLGWFVFPVGLALASVAVRWRPAMRSLCLLVVALLLAAGIGFGDRRPEYRRIEARMTSSGLPAWQAVLPVDRTVFWPERLPMVWTVLRRSSYTSRQQTAVAVFVREGAFEAQRRTRVVAAIGGRDGVFDYLRPAVTSARREPALDDLVAACADPKLGFVVLEAGLDAPLVPDFVDPNDGRRFRLYDCARYRE